MKVMGLDPSTKTGICILDNSPYNVIRTSLLTSTKKGIERVIDLGNKLAEFLVNYKTDLCVIENYGFSNAHTLVPLVEIGTIFRLRLVEHGIKYVELPPTSLKKLITGKGNSKKEIMILETFKRFGHSFPTNDIADAFGLAVAGLVLNGIDVGLPKSHTESLLKGK